MDEIEAYCELTHSAPELLHLSTKIPPSSDWKIDAIYLAFPDGKLPQTVTSTSHELSRIEILRGNPPTHVNSLAPPIPVDMALYFDQKKPQTKATSTSIDLSFDSDPFSQTKKSIDAFVSISNSSEQQLLEAVFDGSELSALKLPQDKKNAETLLHREIQTGENAVESSPTPSSKPLTSLEANTEVQKLTEQDEEILFIPRCLISSDGERFYPGLYKDGKCIFSADESDAFIVHVLEDEDEAQLWDEVEEDGEIFFVPSDQDVEEVEISDDDDDEQTEEEYETIKLTNLFKSRAERRQKKSAKKLKKKMNRIQRKQKRLIRQQKRLDRKEQSLDKTATRQLVPETMYKPKERVVLKEQTARSTQSSIPLKGRL